MPISGNDDDIAGDPAHTAAHPSALLGAGGRLPQDQQQSLELWTRMLSCTLQIENELRGRLRATFGITLPRFDLMVQLQRHPQGLRMGQLSKRMMVTGGNITGITDQLEREKLVVRVPDAKDGRACSVRLTAAGSSAVADMATAHASWITELLQDMPAADKSQLIGLLSQMNQRLHQAECVQEEK